MTRAIFLIASLAIVPVANAQELPWCSHKVMRLPENPRRCIEPSGQTCDCSALPPCDPFRGSISIFESRGKAVCWQAEDMDAVGRAVNASMCACSKDALLTRDALSDGWENAPNPSCRTMALLVLREWIANRYDPPKREATIRKVEKVLRECPVEGRP